MTSQLRGGQIGANITLRDTTLPTDQAELDEFAQNLAEPVRARRASSCSPIRPGHVPRPAPCRRRPRADGYVGFAGTIQVNPAVQATPSLVRDGTVPASDADTRRPASPASSKEVLNYTFGQNRLGLASCHSNTSGLGPDRHAERALYRAPDHSAASPPPCSRSQAQESAAISTQADTEQAVQTTLASKLSAQSGVNMDTEMSHMIQLQNAYGGQREGHRRHAGDVDAAPAGGAMRGAP